MNYSVLGLDQSMRHTGWGHYYRGAKAPTWGTFELPHWGAQEGLHALKFYKWLINFCRERSVTHLFWENTLVWQSNFQPTSEELAQKGLVLLCDMAAAELGIIGQMVKIDDWRGRFLGTSRAPPHIRAARRDIRRQWWKGQAKRACELRNWWADDDNAAEALGVMDFGICTIDGPYASATDPIFRRQEARQEKARVGA